ncbi:MULTISPECIES: CPBP family intramembrane glutamic endopeptidase [Acidithiobacillus]|uniref:CAAX protease family protein n=1 Tax=Acidithiobacillus thiooxidans ATCC 19377 TaxID=637390 RepID=A0A5P9XRE8_ACITH|nr:MULTISPECIES: CPBP family intramembrane glutamic endopeptidase [Acidithiobacillus]MBU2741000.1 CPBP family intramembrane metalloprotease [Acidithiobacillus albertensis]MDA8177013.1 CPBP family intramembrane metalloprotease [Acidithiobacillus sp.]QFX95726.1 CAAX protease family protein [Acidithiobacillus thiooxidans ATCC 19377]
MGIWRCLHPRLLFQENLTLILGSLLFLMGMGITIGFALSTQAKPQASQAVFTMILLPAFFIVAGFLIHYWRIISEDLLRILPGFRRQAIGIFVFILILLLVIIAGEMRFSNIPLAGAFILTVYVAFWAAFYAILLNTGGSRRKDRKYWQGFPLLPVYPLIFFPPARDVFLAIPAPVDSVLGILLLLLIVLLMRKTPRQWQEFLSEYLHRPQDIRIQNISWSAPWRWMPGNWHNPILDTARRPQGILAVLFIQPLFPAALIALQFLRVGTSHWPQVLPFLPVIFLLPVLSWGNWSARAFDWQYLTLTGYFGGNHQQASTHIVKSYAAHTSLLALVLLFWPALILILLGYPILQISMILLILYMGILVLAWAPMGIIGLGFTGILQQIILLLSFGLDAVLVLRSAHYWFYRHLIHVPFHLRGTLVLMFMALVSVGFAAYLVRQRLSRSDWNLSQFSAQKIRQTGQKYTLSAENNKQRTTRKSLNTHWGPWAAIILFLSFFFGQAIIVIIMVMLRDFVVGAQLGMHYALLHEKMPPLVLEKSLHQISTTFRIWLGILSYTLCALAILIFLLMKFPREVWRKAEGFAWRKPSRPNAYLLALILVILIGLIAHGLFQVFPPPSHLNPRALGLFEGLKGSGLRHYVVLLLLIVIAPFTEEIIFRGAIYAGLRRRFSSGWSALFVSLLFVLAHVPSKIEQFHYPPALIIIVLLAAALIFLRIRYRSLWPGILLHMVWNGSGFLLLLWH